MQLKFEQLDYQNEAIGAVLDLFVGEPNHLNQFELGNGNTFIVSANRLDLPQQEIGKNLNAVQRRFRQPETEIGQYGMNFSIEMETGTGKTYVYLHTIFELNRRYGWQKFVIVVPSVAIREGVLQSIRATREHFANAFDKPVVNANVYDSKRLNILRGFAQNRNIEILVINIDAFKKDGNVINRINESGEAPIKQISDTRPIVIMDEPQNMETEASKQAVDSLNPLFVLRYSATHKQPCHKLYCLNPIEAYNKKLVKQIEVISLSAKNDVNGAYVVLKEIVYGKNKKPSAKVEIHYRDKKAIVKKTVTAKEGNDLFDKSNGNESYRHGFIVNGMDAENGRISFSGGTVLTIGENDDAVRDAVMKKQMEATIREHLHKEKRLTPKGIKVLSLFFIDKVANYRNDGKFARWFAEIYQRETGESADGVHDGYFSEDRKEKGVKTNKEKETATYELIMRDKEKLLSFDSPLRFIFSHSALKEGWDNPNVFQICTFNETRSPIKKRQEIGRGLRLAVNQRGERVRDEGVNILTVVPNESYEIFAANLQKEYEDECGIKFNSPNSIDGDYLQKHETRKRQTFRKGFTLDENFAAIWEKLRHNTRYRVDFSREDLIGAAAERLQAMPEVQKPKVLIQKARLNQSQTDGVWGEGTGFGSADVEGLWTIPDVLNEIQKKTRLTRRTLFEILVQSGRIGEIPNNPQLFIDLAAEKILSALHGLMVEGIEYIRLPESDYEQSLAKWRGLEENGVEFFLNRHTFEVKNAEKTIVADHIPLDSKTENTFASDCESRDDVLFYFKLPAWFKVPTPVGKYNPDWAVVMKNREKVYFVAETKNTGKGIQEGVDEDKLRESERQKIACARKCFEVFDGVRYRVVEKLSELDTE